MRRAGEGLRYSGDGLAPLLGMAGVVVETISGVLDS